MKANLKVPFGRHQDRLVAPSEPLASGLACECTCPGCGARLMLRQGRKRRHFAHHNAPVLDNCISQAIHSAAIQVLLQAKHVWIPAHSVEVRRYAASGEVVERRLELCKPRIVHFEECLAEVTISHPDVGTIRPDVVGYRGDRHLFVEMWYTHQVDDEKKKKLAGFGIPTIEIWLRDLDLEEGFSAIERRVLNEPLRHWLFFPGENEARRRLEAEVDKEVERLNVLYKRKRERARLKAAAAQAEQALRQQRALQQRQKEETKFLVFRQRPVIEKERVLRTALGIRGEWPYYLRRANRDNAAIQAPYRLWQASVFYHFIYRKTPMETSFGLVEVTDWVRNWFGESSLSNCSSLDAVKRFLFYMDGCGFLEYAGPGTGGKFTVKHNELAPPARKLEIPAPNFMEQAKARLNAPAYENIVHVKQKVSWASKWPEQETVKQAIMKWLYMSQSDELKILETLFQNRHHLPAPMEFAALMADQMPLTVVLNFLRNYQFVE